MAEYKQVQRTAPHPTWQLAAGGLSPATRHGAHRTAAMLFIASISGPFLANLPRDKRRSLPFNGKTGDFENRAMPYA